MACRISKSFAGGVRLRCPTAPYDAAPKAAASRASVQTTRGRTDAAWSGRGNARQAPSSRSPESTTSPPIDVPCPPMYLVAECPTMSTPWSKAAEDRRRYGVVEDQRQPRSCAAGPRRRGRRRSASGFRASRRRPAGSSRPPVPPASQAFRARPSGPRFRTGGACGRTDCKCRRRASRPRRCFARSRDVENCVGVRGLPRSVAKRDASFERVTAVRARRWWGCRAPVDVPGP